MFIFQQEINPQGYYYCKKLTTVYILHDSSAYHNQDSAKRELQTQDSSLWFLDLFFFFLFPSFPPIHIIHLSLLYYTRACVRTGLMRKEGPFSTARSPWPQHHLPTNVCCNSSFGTDGQLHLVSVFTSWIIFIIILLLEILGRQDTLWEGCQTFPTSLKTLAITYIHN